MSSPLATIEAEALLLSPEERALLADHLLASLGTEQKIDDAWAAEVGRRVAEIENGSMPVSPVEEAIARARQSLR